MPDISSASKLGDVASTSRPRGLVCGLCTRTCRSFDQQRWWCFCSCKLVVSPHTTGVGPCNRIPRWLTRRIHRRLRRRSVRRVDAGISRRLCARIARPLRRGLARRRLKPKHIQRLRHSTVVLRRTIIKHRNVSGPQLHHTDSVERVVVLRRAVQETHIIIATIIQRQSGNTYPSLAASAALWSADSGTPNKSAPVMLVSMIQLNCFQIRMSSAS